MGAEAARGGGGGWCYTFRGVINLTRRANVEGGCVGRGGAGRGRRGGRKNLWLFK